MPAERPRTHQHQLFARQDADGSQSSLRLRCRSGALHPAASSLRTLQRQQRRQRGRRRWGAACAQCAQGGPPGSRGRSQSCRRILRAGRAAATAAAPLAAGGTALPAGSPAPWKGSQRLARRRGQRHCCCCCCWKRSMHPPVTPQQTPRQRRKQMRRRWRRMRRRRWESRLRRLWVATAGEATARSQRWSRRMETGQLQRNRCCLQAAARPAYAGALEAAAAKAAAAANAAGAGRRCCCCRKGTASGRPGRLTASLCRGLRSGGAASCRRPRARGRRFAAEAQGVTPGLQRRLRRGPRPLQCAG